MVILFFTTTSSQFSIHKTSLHPAPNFKNILDTKRKQRKKNVDYITPPENLFYHTKSINSRMKFVTGPYDSTFYLVLNKTLTVPCMKSTYFFVILNGKENLLENEKQKNRSVCCVTVWWCIWHANVLVEIVSAFWCRCVLCVTCYSDLTHTFLVFLANCCQMQFYPRNCISCCWYCEIVNKISPISSLTVYELRVVSLQIANSKQNRIQDKAPHWRFFVPWMWTN